MHLINPQAIKQITWKTFQNISDVMQLNPPFSVHVIIVNGQIESNWIWSANKRNGLKKEARTERRIMLPADLNYNGKNNLLWDVHISFAV